MVKRIKGSCLLALPQSAARILELSRDPENGPAEFATAITADIGLTAQILRFVNSSYFGFRNKISTIQMALSLVYGRTIKNFVLWNAVFALLPDPKCGPFELKKICQDALRRGVFAKIFASHFPALDAETLFLSSLFQDMALPILAQTWPTEYAEILARRMDTNIQLSKLEREYFGWDHALAGSYLAEEWGFEETFCDMIAVHSQINCDIDIKKCTEKELGQAIVCLSSLLPSVIDVQWLEADDFFNFYFKLIHPGMPYPDVLFRQIEEQVSELNHLAHLGNVSNSLTDFHRQWLKTFDPNDLPKNMRHGSE